jgi:dTDP-4-dehydrorhamnose reductase
VWRIIDRDRQGVFHCCGGEAVGRRQLARLAADVFELDPELLRSGPPGPDDVPPIRVPYNTSLTAPVTRAALDVELLSVRELLARFRTERETGALAVS